MSGFNTRLEYRGAAYLVQTQDKGPAAPYVESLIYRAGVLLTSRRKSYSDLLDAPDRVERIARLVEDQHKAVLEEIVEGRFS